MSIKLGDEAYYDDLLTKAALEFESWPVGDDYLPGLDVLSEWMLDSDGHWFLDVPGGTITRTEWEERRRELINDPGGKVAPDWALWKVQEPDGTWWWHEVVPIALESRWDPLGKHMVCTFGALPAGRDWRKTLTRLDDPRESCMSCGDMLSRHEGAELNGKCQDCHDDLTGPEDVAITSCQGFLDSSPAVTASKYHREIQPGVWVDVYDVLNAWGVRNPALQHLIKKALAPGERGHKTLDEDMNDIVASAIRARELIL